MKETVTICGMLLDASGSMIKLRDSVISGVNEYIDQLKQDYEDHPEHGKILCTVATFRGDRTNSEINTLYNLTDIREVEPITKDDYQPKGGTPLFDAIYSIIIGVDQFLEGKVDKSNPKNNALINFMEKNKGKEIEYKVVCVVQTDGDENASKKVTTKKALKELIEKHEGLGWNFVFLGANLDAMQEGMALGMSAGNTYSYNATPTDTMRVYRGASLGVSALRSSNSSKIDNFSSYIPEDNNESLKAILNDQELKKKPK